MTWTILEETKKNNRSMYKVQCDCGKIELRRKDHVDSQRTKSCKSCSAKRTASLYPLPIHRTGYLGLSGTHFLSIKSGAEKRNISFNVVPEYLWNLYVEQNSKCAVSGIDIVLVNKTKTSNPDWSMITASLDRIDSSKGYQPGNVWWVHKRVNRLKNDFSMDELLYWSQAIVKQHGNPEPSRSEDAAEGATTRDRDLRVSNIPTSAQPQEFDIEYYKSRKYILSSMLLGDDIV